MLAMIGMPRSGTTWVAKAIDSHPETYYLHEPDSELRMDLPQIIANADAEQHLPLIKTYLSKIESVNTSKVVGRLPFYRKSYFNSLQLGFNRSSVLANKALGRVSTAFAKSRPLLIKPKKHHVTFWKSIESMGRVSAISQAAPEMKILMLVRHPCAVINSELKGEAANKFASKTPIYENWGLFEHLLSAESSKKYDLDIDKIKAMVPAERLAWRWLIYYEQLLAQAERDNCLLMQYEYLCTEPMQAFGELLNFFNLSFDQQVKDYLVESTSSHSESYYATSKDPKKAMHGWKSKLSIEDIDVIQRVVGDHLNNEYWAA